MSDNSSANQPDASGAYSVDTKNDTANHGTPPELPPTETPELIAPLWKRLMSMMYDAFLLVALSMGYGALMTAINAVQYENINKDYSPTVSGLGFQLGWLLTIFVFYCFFWLKAGQTVGMKAWRLKVVSNNQKGLTLLQCLIRFVVGFVSLAFAGLGFWWSLIDKNKATWHDRLSQSRIILTPKIVKRK